jgi:DnaJ-class molecular chaperone
MKKDFYKVLGVNPKAGPEKIKRAYRQAAKRYHPDVSPRNGEKFREVQEAYDTLSDPEKRAIYDREILEKKSPALSPQPYYPYPLRSYPSSLFDEIAPFLGRFEDLWVDEWADFFSGRKQSHQHLSVEITLTSSEARKGCRIPLQIPIWAICGRCGGGGFVGELICGHCQGSGEEKLEKEIKIAIPPGIRSGTEIRIPLEDLGLRGGDLIAAVKVIRR